MFIDINNTDNFYINGNQGEKVYLQGRQIYPRNYYNEYFTIEPLSSGYLSSEQDLYYTTDDITWNFLSSNTPVYINDNKKYKIKGGGCIKLYYTGNYNIYGNILSLFYGDDFLPVRGVRLKGLFKNQTGLINAGNLILPNILHPTGECYMEMFDGCTSLVSAPALPATTLYGYSYYCMFRGCTSLVNAPDLPATSLSVEGAEYWQMFDGCTSLVSAPALPATTVKGYSYCGMFRGCTSLVNAPALPATTLSYDCYKQMFQGCTSLVNAPALPAEDISQDCYVQMFQGCTSLVNAPTTLPATKLYSGCYQYMFAGCTSLVNAPDLPATTLKDSSYYSMFIGCTSLNHVKCLAQIFQSNSTTDWLSNVSSTGTFVKDDNTTWPTGASGIPTGWTIHNEHEHDYSRDYLTFKILENGVIPWKQNTTAKTIEYSLNNGPWTSITSTSAGTMINVSQGDTIRFRGNNTTYCASGNSRSYSGFGNGQGSGSYVTDAASFNVEGNILSLIYGDNFVNQTSFNDRHGYQFCSLFKKAKVISAENLILPVTTLTDSCYRAMFGDCTLLTIAPVLPATTLFSQCYYYMFQKCTSLNYIKCLATDISANNCTKYWTINVSPTGTFIKDTNTTWTTGSDGIPSGWTVINV